MFGMVVLFGLYHGLIFLPVLLSLIGPPGPPEPPGPPPKHEHAQYFEISRHNGGISHHLVADKI